MVFTQKGILSILKRIYYDLHGKISLIMKTMMQPINESILSMDNRSRTKERLTLSLLSYYDIIISIEWSFNVLAIIDSIPRL